MTAGGVTLCARTDPTTRALYEHVLREPWLDAPRLVVADKLEELGDVDQAEFIRSQLRRANMHRFGGAPWEMHQLLARESQLLAVRRRAWIGELPFVALLEFVRGFPGIARMTPAELMRRGTELFERFPIIGLECHDRDTPEHLWGLEELLESPWLERLELLRLPKRPDRRAEISRSARATNLRIVTPAPATDALDSLGLRGVRWATPAADKVDPKPGPPTRDAGRGSYGAWDPEGLELANLRVDDAKPPVWLPIPRLRLELPRGNTRFTPRARSGELPPSILVVLDLRGAPSGTPLEEEGVLELRGGIEHVETERTAYRWRHFQSRPGWDELKAIVARAGDRVQVDVLAVTEDDFMADLEDSAGRSSGFAKKHGWWLSLPHGTAYSAVLFPRWSDATLREAKRECDAQLTVAFSPRMDETTPAAFDRLARCWEIHGLACDPDEDDPATVATALSQRVLASLATIFRRRSFESPAIAEAALNLWLEMVTSDEDASKLRWSQATVSAEWRLRLRVALHHRPNGRVIDATAETGLARHRNE